jgi:WD40 repeat protein
MWDAASGIELLCLRGHKHSVLSVAFSPDGNRLASGSWDQTLRIWDAVSGEERFCLRGHDSPVGSVAFSPDGQRLVSGGDNQSVRLWDGTKGTVLLSLCNHQDSTRSMLRGVAFSADGRRIASETSVFGEYDEVRVWDSANGDCLQAARLASSYGLGFF